MKNKFFVFITTFIIILSVFVVHSFAESYSVNTPLCPYYASNSNKYTWVDTTVSDDLLYIFKNNSSGLYMFACESSFKVAYEFNSSSTVPPSTFQYYVNNSTYNSTYNLYYSDIAMYSANNQLLLSDIYSYSSRDDGLSAIRDYIDNPPSNLPNDGFDGLLTIPAGNVAYIRVNGGDMELSAVMNSKSGLLMNGNSWGNNARIAYGVSDLPSSGTTFPLSSMSFIPWMKQAQGQDLLGRTKYAGYPKSNLLTSDNYIVIYNPASPSLSSKGFDDGADELNPTITAHFTKLVDYKTFPLTLSYNIQTNELTSDSISGYSDYYDGSPDSNGNFTESPSNSSMPSEPVSGGTGGISDSSQSIIDYVRQIGNILSTFTHNLIELIQAPISHIGQIIDAGSGFMSALRGMYAWMPADIQGLVISALTVVIGIGVFKVFL